MITDFLVKKYIGNNVDYENGETRLKIGYLSSILGIVLNLLLTGSKIGIGLLTGSISIVADGINNLSDMSSAVMTLVGLKMSSKPSDEEHPYGHGRIEYIAAFIVSVMVIVVGVQLVISSVKSIMDPKEIIFNSVTVVILLLSILIKIFLYRFNNVLGEKINSIPLKATGADALGDVLVTSVVLASFIFSNFTSYNVDGFMGLIVAVLIIHSGYSLVKETVSSLIGEAASEEVKDEIKSIVLSYDHVLGIHDLMIHSYGHGQTMATLDVNIPWNIDVVTIHEVIDLAEREVLEKMNIRLVIHMDPVGHLSEEDREVLKHIREVVLKHDCIKSIHDFNIVKELGNEKDIVVFDTYVNGNVIKDDDDMSELKNEIEEDLESLYPNYSYSILFNKYYD